MASLLQLCRQKNVCFGVLLQRDSCPAFEPITCTKIEEMVTNVLADTACSESLMQMECYQWLMHALRSSLLNCDMCENESLNSGRLSGL